MLPRSSPGVRARTALIAIVAALALVVTAGCTNKPSPQEQVKAAADALAAALAAGDLTGLTFAGTPGADANSAYTTIRAGLGSVKPDVGVDQVSVDRDAGTAALTFRWSFAPGARWSYGATTHFTRTDQGWRADWAPSVVHPDLATGDALSLARTQAERGRVTGADGDTLVTLRDVRIYGIDKSVAKSKADASAAALARLADIDASTYRAAVKAAGPKAFVPAITYRADDENRIGPNALRDIVGARVVDGRQMLAPTRTFARALLGTVGPATKEIVDDTHGEVAAGDQTGLSGLQRRYDAQLRGTPELVVRLDPADDAAKPRTLWSRDATAGKALALTLDGYRQQIAESLLAQVKPASSLVAIRPSTGQILAAANGPGSDEQPVATLAQEPPGSTFKIISSLALLRKGVRPDDKVSCPTSITVDGKTFTNYSDYPSSANGTITFAAAVANSCNTAFIGLRDKVTAADLHDAAASLGVGTDYDVGFASFFGSVPADATETGHAAAMIGQGKVTASPLAMAQVAASVSAGHTVIGRLVAGHAAKPSGPALTAEEAKQLRGLMQGVVTDGSGRTLAGLADGAKTGTAEYGTQTPPKTHAWMIAYGDDVAVAVYVADGASGSGTAGPILKDFLRRTR